MTVIFSDSKSVLQAIQNLNWKDPLIYQILQKHDSLYNLNKRVIFFWIPSHIGITGNDKADSAAKDALNINISDIPLPSTDFKYNCYRYILNLWQTKWNQDIDNKLFGIKPKIGNTHLHSSYRKDDVIVTRLRIGHSYYTHSHLLCNTPCPVCTHCRTEISVKHILLDCPMFDNHRQSLQHSNSLFDLKKKNLLDLLFNF